MIDLKVKMSKRKMRKDERKNFPLKLRVRTMHKMNNFERIGVVGPGTSKNSASILSPPQYIEGADLLDWRR